MSRFARTDISPNWKAWAASGAIVPPRAEKRDHLAGVWIVFLILGAIALATAAELGAFR